MPDQFRCDRKNSLYLPTIYTAADMPHKHLLLLTLTLSLLYGLLPTVCLYADEAGPAFRNLGIREGFTQTNVLSLYQDSSGAIWTAGKNGIARYSGVLPEDTMPVASSDFFSPVDVKAVFGEGDDLVYFLMNSNVVEYDIRTAACRQVFSAGLVGGNMLTAACVENGVVCAASENSLYFRDRNGRESCIALPEKGEVTSILRRNDGTVFFSVLSEGLYRLTGGGSIEIVYRAASKINNLFEDSRGILWVCTRSEGLVRLDPDGTAFRYLHAGNDDTSLMDNYVRCICEDDDGCMWIGTMFGLDCLDVEAGVFRHYGKSADSWSGMRNLTVECIMRDRVGKIWCGSYYAGLTYFSPEDKNFEIISVPVDSDEPVTIFGDIITDGRGDIWAGTSDRGLYHFDISAGKGRFHDTGNSGIPGDNVKALYYDSQADRLWIGMFIGGVAVLDMRTGRVDRIDLSAEGCSAEDLGIVHSLDADENYVYAATYAGISRIDRKTLRTSIVVRQPRIFNVLAGKNGKLYAVSGQNVFRVYMKQDDGSYSQVGMRNLKNNKVTVMRQDTSGNIWLGTMHKGVAKFDITERGLSWYDKSVSGISSDYVSAVVPLSSDVVLLGTPSGLSLLDVSSGRSENFTVDTGFPLSTMENGSLFRDTSGRIYASGVNAIAVFTEDVLSGHTAPTGICLTSMSVNDVTVFPGDASGILSVPLQYTSDISLGYRARILDFTIGTDRPGDFSMTDFQYRLSGYDDEWKILDGTSIRYMNLPPGNYDLELRTRPDKLFGDMSGTTLKLKVHPPFYASTFAYCIYFLLVIGVTAILVAFFYSRRQFRQTLEFERKDKERIEQVNQWKLVFFTNISHEIKTPLTLIMSQLDMISGYRFGEPANTLLVGIRRNVQKLKMLVEELLDFRKQEQGHMSLKVSRSDIVSYLRSVCDDFREFAAVKNVDFTFRTSVENLQIMFDRVQLQKVFYNLVSNAFKHTGPGGTISVSLDADSDNVSVRVADTGSGIDKSKFESIFERFYHEGADASDAGVGIGLALSKGIVILHGGTISVESEPGKGSVFTVRLDRNYDFSSAENAVVVDGKEDTAGDAAGLRPSAAADPTGALPSLTASDRSDREESAEEAAREGRPVLLVVEDDFELQKILEQVFSVKYDVHVASDGREGLDLARTLQPDIVISDVMMPVMSGIEMCRMLKSDFETCHIPVVLLTALSSSGEFVEGLESGADDYIAKPFETDILVAKCGAILRNRDILRKKYISGSGTGMTETGSVPAQGQSAADEAVSGASADGTVNQSVHMSRMDSEFAATVMNLIRSHLDDPDLDINFMCRELALSRTLLFVKIKGVFGKTPTGLVQDVRLEEAAWLLREKPDMMISEVADMVGVNSLQYFGKIFRAHFGMTPRAYRSAHGR